MDFVQLNVGDQGENYRYAIHTQGLSRKRLQQEIDVLVAAIRHAKKTCEGRELEKVVVFSYKDQESLIKKLWPEATFAYFGNTRGYDFYFQQGYDAFVTIGDPISNMDALALQWSVLTGGLPDNSEAWKAYVESSASSELAQAHGRARSPQLKKGFGERLHLHYGTKIPMGWDRDNCTIDTITGMRLAGG
jgi:hypothetical protein